MIDNRMELDVVEKEIVITAAVDHHKYVVYISESESVLRFVEKVAFANDLGKIQLKYFKVMVGSQNINLKKYHSKKISFFLVENRPIFASLVVKLLIFDSDHILRDKINYVVDTDIRGYRFNNRKYMFRNGVEFNYRSKDHQFRISKEGILIEKKGNSSRFSQIKTQRTRGYKGGGGNDFDSVPTLENNISRDGNVGFNFSNQSRGGNDMFNQSSSGNDMFNQSSSGNDMFNFSSNPTHQRGENDNQNQNYETKSRKQSTRSRSRQKPKKEVKFIDVENSRIERFKLSDDNSIPDYRTCDDGINFFADCSNNRCKAFGKQVVCPMGYGDFDMTQRKTKCPSCKKYVSAMTCGFQRSWWKFCGIKTDGTVVNKDWILAGDTDFISMFVPNSLKKSEPIDVKKFCAEWKVLKFQIRDPNKCAAGMDGEKLDPDKSFCSICIENIEKFGELQVTKCFHYFHKQCIQSWIFSKIQNENLPTCPMCRKSVGDIKIDKKLKLKFETHWKKRGRSDFGLMGSFYSDSRNNEKDMVLNQLCVDNNQCTILNAGQEFCFQDWYYCKTCKMGDNHGVCETCRKICHAGHETYLSKDSPSRFRCCCGNGECEVDCKCIKIGENTTVKNGPMFVGEKIKHSKKILDDALRSNCCTFNITGRNYMYQEAYNCKNCHLNKGYVMCVICAEKCHKGHNVVKSLVSKESYCDCGCGKGLVPCKCMSRENKRKRKEIEEHKRKKRKNC